MAGMNLIVKRGSVHEIMSFPCGTSGKKNHPVNAGDLRDAGLIPGLGRSPGGGQFTPVFLPGESHGQRNLAGYSP